MAWWIWLTAGLAALAVAVQAVIRIIRQPDPGQHVFHGDPAARLLIAQDFYGSMTLPEERTWRGHAEDLLPDGHTWGCLRPTEDHPVCPEEGDTPDDYPWPTMPDMLPAGPPADVVAAALASAQAAPEDAGWTDQLLADLHDAPTALDGLGHRDGPSAVQGPDGGVRNTILRPVDGQPEAPSLERLADTGEIRLASLRADYAAELRAQDDDAAEFISRLATGAAEFRLSAHGLA